MEAWNLPDSVLEAYIARFYGHGTYEAKYWFIVAPSRAAHLHERIAEHKPASVVFYGRAYDHWWRSVAGVSFETCEIGRVSIAKNEHTLFVVMPHPTAFGLPNSYFEEIGCLIGKELKSTTRGRIS